MRNSKQASARTPARAVEPENEEKAGDIVMAAICLQELQPPLTPIRFSLTPSQTTTCSSPDGLVNSSSPGDTPTKDVPEARPEKPTPSPATADAANLAISLKARPKAEAPLETMPLKPAGRVVPVKDERRVEIKEASPVQGHPSDMRQTNWIVPEQRMIRDTDARVTEMTQHQVETLAEIDPVRGEQSTPVKAPGTLRNISVQVGEPGQPKVEVQLAERAGELYVSVRSGDAETVRGLRHNLPELVNRLEESGFTSAGWRPSGVIEGPAQASASRQGSAEYRDQQPEPQTGGSNRGPDQREQGHSNRRQWVEEFEGTQTDVNRFAGELHGFSR